MHSFRPAHSSRRRDIGGFTLVELMVGLGIGLFILSGLTVLYMNVKTSFNSQAGLANLQATRRAAITSLGHGVRSAGYYVDPLFTTRATVFPRANGFAAGQFMLGSDGVVATGGASSDVLSVRFETQPGDALVDCVGNFHTGEAKRVVLNTYTVNAQGELTCSADGASPVALVGGVLRLELRYSVDTDGDGQPDSYLTASALTAADLWAGVYAVRARLTFRDTVSSQGPSALALPPLVHIFPVMNRS